MTKNNFWRIPAPDRAELRKFGLIMAGGLGLIALFLWYKEVEPVAWGLGGLAGVFLVAGLALPPALGPIYVVWMLLARILGFVNTHILLALVFYTLFATIGGIMRLFRHDPLDRPLRPEQKTYWLKRPSSQLSREHYKRQF